VDVKSAKLLKVRQEKSLRPDFQQGEMEGSEEKEKKVKERRKEGRKEERKKEWMGLYEVRAVLTSIAIVMNVYLGMYMHQIIVIYIKFIVY